MSAAKETALATLAAEAEQRCGHPVLMGEGNLDAGFVLVLDAPETATQLLHPQTQQLMTELLHATAIAPTNLYITTLIKCNQQDMDMQFGLLEQQISIIAPKVIGLAGRQAIQPVFGEQSIHEIHGTVHYQAGHIWIPLMRPAILQSNPALKPILESDFRVVASHLQSELPADAPPPEQLDLF